MLTTKRVLRLLENWKASGLPVPMLLESMNIMTSPTIAKTLEAVGTLNEAINMDLQTPNINMQEISEISGPREMAVHTTTVGRVHLLSLTTKKPYLDFQSFSVLEKMTSVITTTLDRLLLVESSKRSFALVMTRAHLTIPTTSLSPMTTTHPHLPRATPSKDTITELKIELSLSLVPSAQK